MYSNSTRRSSYHFMYFSSTGRSSYHFMYSSSTGRFLYHFMYSNSTGRSSYHFSTIIQLCAFYRPRDLYTILTGVTTPLFFKYPRYHPTNISNKRNMAFWQMLFFHPCVKCHLVSKILILCQSVASTVSDRIFSESFMLYNCILNVFVLFLPEGVQWWFTEFPIVL